MKYLQQFFCFFFHFLGFVCGLLMVVAQKMQRSVNEKLVKAVLHAHASPMCFALRCVGGNHNIAQKVGSNICELALPHGKCDHICRALAVQILVVKLRNLLIVHNQNGKFCVRIVQGA